MLTVRCSKDILWEAYDNRSRVIETAEMAKRVSVIEEDDEEDEVDEVTSYITHDGPQAV